MTQHVPRKDQGPKKCIFCNKEIIFKPDGKSAWVHADTQKAESKEPELHNARPWGNY